MNYRFLLFFVFFSMTAGFSQNSLLWKGYFSYNHVTDLAQSDTRFLAASENAVFSKNLSTNEIKTINTIDGLSSQVISAIYYSTATQKTYIGYENGLMIVISADGSIRNVVDIISKQIPPNIKKINHFMEHEGILYLSCDFGITQYNMTTMQFGDTYFIGTGTAEIVVSQTAFFNGFIYAATTSEGLKRADITNPDLIDAGQWAPLLGGNFSGVETFEDNVFAVSANGSVSKSSNGIAFSGFGPPLSPSAVDIRATAGHLVITTPTTIYIYNQQQALVLQLGNSQITSVSASFTCATVISGTIFMGTQENGV
ncbi:MAG: hypothetical protein K2X80_04245, partial [Pseudomonadaceae bacterium]|nr:hypothetical protein [Pseudomonadaceae bacterium]